MAGGGGGAFHLAPPCNACGSPCNKGIWSPNRSSTNTNITPPCNIQAGVSSRGADRCREGGAALFRRVHYPVLMKAARLRSSFHHEAYESADSYHGSSGV